MAVALAETERGDHLLRPGEISNDKRGYHCKRDVISCIRRCYHSPVIPSKAFYLHHTTNGLVPL
ncbi:MAG: hypothetical protein A2Z77_07095 [Chloroflexi bacterium RBG_13_51_36]|nr:MAG: hypothetical protein A2Z77_07095 [Chloroflexi bacterium RBG_13_51_36]